MSALVKQFTSLSLYRRNMDHIIREPEKLGPNLRENYSKIITKGNKPSFLVYSSLRKNNTANVEKFNYLIVVN